MKGGAAADESDSLAHAEHPFEDTPLSAVAGVREGKGLDPPRPPPTPPRGGASAPDPRWVGATGLMNTDAAVSGQPFTSVTLCSLHTQPVSYTACPPRVGAKQTRTDGRRQPSPRVRSNRTIHLSRTVVASTLHNVRSLGAFSPNGPRRGVGYVARALLVCTRALRAAGAWLWTRLTHAYVYVRAGVSRAAPGVFFHIVSLGVRLSGFV
jgi:hypothetical protein